MPPNLPEHDVVLLGIGHTNAHVLRMWRMEPIRGARLTCVSNFPAATYSGMLPGVLAGQYPPEAMEIDLVRLCAAAGARLIQGNVVGLDRQRRELWFDDRPPLPFDVLSIGIGSVPNREGLQAADDTLLPIKPMQTFLPRLEERLKSGAGFQPAGNPTKRLNIVIVGGGVGGIEIAFCLPRRLEALLGSDSASWRKLTIVEAGSQIGGGLRGHTATEIGKLLASRKVEIVLGRRVTHIANRQVWLDDGSPLPADMVLWATGASPPPLLAALDLPKDDRGFLLTDSTLECVAGERIFAVGDTGSIRGQSIAKAGVYAVREGPVLWDNIGRAIRGATLRPYRPQKRFLKLINTGDDSSIGDYLGGTLGGRVMWWLKDRIDRKFMAMYQDYTPTNMADHDDLDRDDQAQLRCAGCGGKVGGSVLAKALARLETPTHPNVVLGLSEPDDAAILRANSQQIAITIDFFAAPFDDAYLVGRMAAIHAATDVLAKGAGPVAALAIASIPPGPEKQQEQILYELLAGGLVELKAMGATLAGGHTIEGPQTTIGYTMVAEQRRPIRAKSGLLPGDSLVLTKPLGTGVLLAAQMQARLKAAWWKPLIDMMLRSNAPAAALCDEFHVQAATDISGFGLAGHLLEMLHASSAAAEIQLDAILLLPGAGELLADGLQSTLHPANQDVQSGMQLTLPLDQPREYSALFDPQTCGGLLIGINEDRAAEFCRRLCEAGDGCARVIGKVTAPAGPRRLTVLNRSKKV
jgi:selenide, water dikinase